LIAHRYKLLLPNASHPVGFPIVGIGAASGLRQRFGVRGKETLYFSRTAVGNRSRYYFAALVRDTNSDVIPNPGDRHHAARRKRRDRPTVRSLGTEFPHSFDPGVLRGQWLCR